MERGTLKLANREYGHVALHMVISLQVERQTMLKEL